MKVVRKNVFVPCLGVPVVLGLVLLTGAGAEEIASPSDSSLLPGRDKGGEDSALDLHTAINQTLGLRSSNLVSLPFLADRGQPLTVVLPIDGQDLVIDLQPHSLRGPNFQVMARQEDGSMEPYEAAPPATLRGWVRGVPGSQVVGSRLSDGLHIQIIIDGEPQIWVEPVGERIAGAADDLHVLYTPEDVLPREGVNLKCGTLDQVKVQEKLSRLDPEIVRSANAAGPLCVADIAFETDFEYFSVVTGDPSCTIVGVQCVVDRIEFIMIGVDIQYIFDVGITYSLGLINVQPFAADPYTSTSDAFALLCEFITHWNTFHKDLDRDVTVMFTGRETTGLVDGATVGFFGLAADIGEICDNTGVCIGFGSGDGAYCFVQAEFDTAGSGLGSDLGASKLTSHELGHLWGASHCTCPGSTMDADIFPIGPGGLIFTPASIADITAHKLSRPCLAGCPLESSGSCAIAPPIADGLIPFSTTGMPTDGPAHPFCDNAGDGGVTVHDIWYTWFASCDGLLTVTTCEELGGTADFNTDIVVYEGTGCGPALMFMDCNDDDLGNPCGGAPGFRSTVTVPVSAGSPYLIRVGGSSVSFPSPAVDWGTGILSVSCVPFPLPCPGDITPAGGNGVVNIDDLVALLGAFGTCPPIPRPCPEDITPAGGNGVVNIDDLVALLGAFGPCP